MSAVERNIGAAQRHTADLEVPVTVGFIHVHLCPLSPVFAVFEDSDASPPRVSTVSLELEHPAERAAWNASASCVVIGDVSGRLHFVTGNGTLLFSQPLAKPVDCR